MPDKNVDVLVVGAGLGGISAALSASWLGAKVVLVEPTEWLGGQLTAQGVCTPDEDALNDQPVVDLYGSTASYRDLKHRIREWYRGNATLSAQGKAEALLNIGQCWVNTGFAVEPNVAVTVLNEMLSELEVTPVFNAAVSANPINNRLAGEVSVTLADGTSSLISAAMILDATETGDLLPLLNLPYAIGWEAQSDTTEPDAPEAAHPEWIQPITFPIALIHRPAGEDHTIPEPPNYEEIKVDQCFSLVDGAITAMFTGAAPFWIYRRIIDRGLFNDPNYAFDVATINVAANDYKGGIYPDDVNPGNNEGVLGAARAASLAYMFWLQTEAPRDDGVTSPGWPELMPATYFFNAPDAISPQPYVRESRRIIPVVRVLEQDIAQVKAPAVRAARLFKDSCGIGNYGMDVHGGANGGPEFQAPTSPYQIPAGSLVPLACDNVLASGKCLGVTHITNGAYRLHPQEWNVGESAGVLAAFCVQNGTTPAQVVAGDPLLAQYQNALLDRGVPLFWWSDVLGQTFWSAIQMCGVRGAFEGDPGSLAFRPGDPFSTQEQADMEAKLGQTIPWQSGPVSRAEAAQAIATSMNWV